MKYVGFKFKNEIQHTAPAVKSPPPTCYCMKDINFPSGKLTLSRPLVLSKQSMQRKIATFSSAPEDDDPSPIEISAKPSKQISIRKLNHDPFLSAEHHDDRCFLSEQIWIQGLPVDPKQAKQIVKYVCAEYSLPLAETSLAEMGKQFLAFNNKSNSGPTRFRTQHGTHTAIL